MTMSKALGQFKPADSKFEFRKYPFYWVMRLGNRYTQVMEKKIKRVGMNITSWRVGMILKEYGVISMTDIATHAVGRLPTITKTVYRMQEQGLVDIRANKNDGRVTMVSITQEGKKLIDTVIEKTEKTINRAFEDMTKKEIEQLNELLKKIFDNLS